MTSLDLPASVLSKVELSPAEDMGAYILSQGLPGVEVVTQVDENPPEAGFVLVRKDDPMGGVRYNEHAIGFAHLFVNTFTNDPDGDEKGALLSEACRVVLRDAWEQKLYVPNRGWVLRIRCLSTPTRVTDWATSSGPVQYADLPTGYWRYESKFSIKWRRDAHSSFI